MTHRTDSSSRGREARVRAPAPRVPPAPPAQVGGGWVGREPGSSRSSGRGPRPAPAPPPGECCYSSSGCSSACSRGNLRPPSIIKISELDSRLGRLLTLVSCGLGGPCILQLYMFWPGPAPWPGYCAPPPAPPPGESLLAPETGSCHEPAPPPPSPGTAWLGA